MRWLVLFLILLAACRPAVVAPQPNITVTECNPPYYEYTPSDCCLDQDTNGVCDRDEKPAEGPIVINKTKVIEPGPVLERTIMADLIAKFRQNVTSYSFTRGTDKYFVMNEFVHVKLGNFKELPFKTNDVRTYITDIFVDRRAQKAIGYCDPRTEEEIVGEFNADRSKCIKLINIPIALPYAEYNPYLPEDWLQRFSHALPARVEATDQYIKQPTGWFAVNPVLHYVSGDVPVVIRVDKRTALPVQVEVGAGPALTRTEYDWLIVNSVQKHEVEYQPFLQ